MTASRKSRVPSVSEAERVERRQDIATGFVFAAIGLVAAILARDYAGVSGGYPAALGILLMLFGLGLALRAGMTGADMPRPLIDHGPRFLLGLAVIGVYLAAVSILGFYTAGFLLMLALPVLLGFRRPVFVLATAVGFSAVVYLIFTVLLAKPLPPDLWHPSRWPF